MRQHGRRGQARATRRERELRPARPRARSGLARGTVVWAALPSAGNASVTHARPGVIVGVAGRDVRLFPLTSSHREVVRESPLYVRLEDWGRAGLSRPCRVARQSVTVDVMDVSVRVGSLSASDLARVFPDDAVA